MTISIDASPAQLLGGLQFSTTSPLIVPVVTQLAGDTQVAHRAFHESPQGAFHFVGQFGSRGFPNEQIKTRWGNGIINISEADHSLNVMQVKGAPNDRLTYVACAFDNATLDADRPSQWSPSAGLTYEARGKFTVSQSARMEFYYDDDWLHVKHAGVGRIVVNAGIELVKQLADRYNLPLTGDRFSSNAMFELACAAHAAMEPAGTNGNGGWGESQSIMKIATPEGGVPEVVLKKISDFEIEIANTVVVGPLGMKKPYSPLVVDLVKAAAAMRPDVFPLRM